MLYGVESELTVDPDFAKKSPADLKQAFGTKVLSNNSLDLPKAWLGYLG